MQEVGRLQSQLEATRREPGANGHGSFCGECMAKDARMDGWKKQVKKLISKNDEDKNALVAQLATAREGTARAEEEFQTHLECFRGSMTKLQVELERLLVERREMEVKLLHLERFKAAVSAKVNGV
ncbi:hypothetical protein DQ04_06321050 [Trypanosoma grayi]|uniref:hypothetical protein n=1 Tax=Trypanosoma grayi TaxID=71804 RepID=UPI0004F422E3|nr:hypothetical protein DQ04_06321050 [Trypanosoma grayi]KEG08850.1 hypothetical protein DQ04_06321050 [Trypanosoma grayi]